MPRAGFILAAAGSAPSVMRPSPRPCHHWLAERWFERPGHRPIAADGAARAAVMICDLTRDDPINDRSCGASDNVEETSMRVTSLTTLCVVVGLVFVGQRAAESQSPPAEPDQASAGAYSRVQIDPADEPGTPREVLCQIGDEPEQTCILTPLFGDDSFQLDGDGVALRMVVSGNEGGLFEVISHEQRVPVGGVYRRSSASDPCWVAERSSSSPSPICLR